jgi:hypothetical protein
MVNIAAELMERLLTRAMVFHMLILTFQHLCITVCFPVTKVKLVQQSSVTSRTRHSSRSSNADIEVAFKSFATIEPSATIYC